MKKEICGVLRHDIVNLKFSPGEPLSEMKLAKRYGVSRTPVREAFIRLAEEGLVVMEPNIGTRVSDINIRDLQELIELRVILERGAAKLAVKNATETDIDNLTLLNNELQALQHDDISAHMDCDTRFHRLIGEATHNIMLARQLMVTQNQFTRLQRLHWNKPETLHDYLPRFIEALKNRDEARMEKLLVAHMYLFVERMKQF